MAKKDEPTQVQQEQQRRRRYSNSDEVLTTTSLHPEVSQIVLDFWSRQEDRAASFRNHAEIGARLSQFAIGALGILLLAQVLSRFEGTPLPERLEFFKEGIALAVVGTTAGALICIQVVFRGLERSIKVSRLRAIDAILPLMPRPIEND